jgi:hypothetical protein
VSTYRQLLSTRASDRQRRSPWLHRSGRNGGNGLIATLNKKPSPTLLPFTPTSTVDPDEIRVVNLSTKLRGDNLNTTRADENSTRVSAVDPEMSDIK